MSLSLRTIGHENLASNQSQPCQRCQVPRTQNPRREAPLRTHAIRHGLLAQCVVLQGEDPETFKTLIAELEERFAPVDGVELGMIEEMASAYWRMRRGWTIEAELLNQGLNGITPENYNARLAAAFTGPDQMPKLLLLERYESRLHRMYQRALSNLLLLRQTKQESEVSETAEQPDPISGQPRELQPTVDEALTMIPMDASDPMKLLELILESARCRAHPETRTNCRLHNIGGNTTKSVPKSVRLWPCLTAHALRVS